MKKIMAANWKMYKTATEGAQTATELCRLLQGRLADDREVVIFPPFTAIGAVVDALRQQPGFMVGGQNFYPADQGAFTGEIAPAMLLDLGCRYALVGHSERRHIMGETDRQVADKTAFGLQKGLKIIVCIGEKIEERRGGKVEEVLGRQLETGLSGIETKIVASQLAIAYEPVWAIGTGEVAGPKEIIHAHQFTRERLKAICGDQADDIPILYGGSVKPDSAPSIMALENVDGVLVGGASLDADSFSQIVVA